MDKFKAQVKRMWEEAPVQTALIGLMAANVGIKVLHELTEAHKSRVWSREVDRRRWKL